MKKKKLASLVLVGGLALGCSSLKPIARTAHDVAKSLCALHYSEKEGFSAEEAASKFCETEEQMRPWIEFILRAQKDGVSPEGEPAQE